jgi:mRNA interferase MazF
VIAAVTSNLRLAAAPGNVRLRRGEGGIPKASVVYVSQLYTIDRARLTARLGSLPGARLANVAFGLRVVLGL